LIAGRLEIFLSRCLYKSVSDALGAGNGRTYYDGGGTKSEGVQGLRGVSDVAFQEYGYCQVCHEGLEERPGRGANAGGLGGVAVEGGRDGVGSGTLGGEGVLEGGDVGEDWSVELGVDSGYEFGPGFGSGEAARGTVEGDDVSSGVADGLGGIEVRSYVDVSVGVVGLDDTDDWELGQRAEGCDAGCTFGAETTCSAAENRGCDSGECVEIVQRIAFRGLTGDDDAAAKLLEWRVEGGV